MWQKNLDRSDAVARAVLAIVSRDPSHLKDLAGLEMLEQPLRQALESPDTRQCGLGSSRAACLTALGALARTRGRLEEAEKCYRSAYELQTRTLGAGNQETRWTTEALVQLLEQTGRKAEAGRLRRTLTVAQIMEEGGNLQVLRAKALELFLNGQYPEAEQVYRHLLDRGFELPSTHCHLARLCLMMDREREAAEETERAWGHRQEAPGYIAPRILLLRVLCEMLAKKEVGDLLKRISRALNEPGAHADWTMQPVIEHLKPHLSSNDCVLLTALVEALGDPERVKELQGVPEWLAATSEETDTSDLLKSTKITHLDEAP